MLVEACPGEFQVLKHIHIKKYIPFILWDLRRYGNINLLVAGGYLHELSCSLKHQQKIEH